MKSNRIPIRIKKAYRFFFVRHRRYTLSGLLGTLLIYAFCLPRPLFKSPTCMVLEDSEGGLLGAGIAADGQWRFPHSEKVPDKFERCILEFEDRRFHRHWGVDPVGIARAISQNVRNREIVSGGSTLSMPVIRMARGDRRRNVLNKIIEAIMATRMEITYSKADILALSHGGKRRPSPYCPTAPRSYIPDATGPPCCPSATDSSTDSSTAGKWIVSPAISPRSNPCLTSPCPCPA
jgi:hypothetical protein